jgi:hypothetical protein
VVKRGVRGRREGFLGRPRGSEVSGSGVSAVVRARET